MPTLKISDREAVLTQVLTDAFQPRFDQIMIWLRRELDVFLKATHPTFITLMAKPSTSEYLAKGNVRKFYVMVGNNTFDLYKPKYGVESDMPDRRGVYYRDTAAMLADWDTVVPANLDSLRIDNEAVIQAYRTAWNDYREACQELKALLNSYTTHERLTKDFPEYAKYLPAVPIKSQPPAVIVKDVRKKLSKLGVPSKV